MVTELTHRQKLIYDFLVRTVLEKATPIISQQETAERYPVVSASWAKL